MELTAELAAAEESSSLLRESLEKEKADGAEQARLLSESAEAAAGEATLAATREQERVGELEGQREAAVAECAAAKEAAESLRQEKVGGWVWVGTVGRIG